MSEKDGLMKIVGSENILGDPETLGKWGALGRYKGDADHDMVGPKVNNYHLWLRKIKKAFDPNITSDPSWYITPKE